MLSWCVCRKMKRRKEIKGSQGTSRACLFFKKFPKILSGMARRFNGLSLMMRKKPQNKNRKVSFCLCFNFP